MANRFPGYDVLAKRDTLSWNDKTREVIAERLAMSERSDLLSDRQRATLRTAIDRIVPQPEGRAPVNALALLLAKIADDGSDGHRHHQLPGLRACYERGLDAIEEEAKARHGTSFHLLDGSQADLLLSAIERGDVCSNAWGDLPPAIFWGWRLLPDIVSSYYAHPSAWSAMGFGGPASPRGYVRIEGDRRDPWEAVEADDGTLIPAARQNKHVG
ncbi:gluconate 2-dehydrogenase subunit 3 family protein [Sphingomonas chungangi]